MLNFPFQDAVLVAVLRTSLFLLEEDVLNESIEDLKLDVNGSHEGFAPEDNTSSREYACEIKHFLILMNIKLLLFILVIGCKTTKKNIV